MTKQFVEVGPATVRGPCDVDRDLVSTALECIDDEIAVLDERPVAVTAIWRAVFRSVLSGCDGTAVLVCPTWWSPIRIDRIREAASSVATEVVVLQRADVLTDTEPGTPTVVEIAPELVVVWCSGGVVTAEPRLGEAADVVTAVAEGVATASSVILDAPVGVVDGWALANAISVRLRADGLAVTTAHRDRVLAGVRDQPTPWEREPDSYLRRVPKGAVLAAVTVSLGLLCVGVASSSDIYGSHAPAVPMTMLVEGRVAVKVPARWVVRRVTSGPGSARLEVTASDDATAVLVTQSEVRRGEQLADTAGTLRSALDDEQAGIFSQFNPDGNRAGRPAATYREAREGRQIDWAVFVDDTVRIAVGCQSTPGREQAAKDVCDEAIRSAHAVI